MPKHDITHITQYWCQNVCCIPSMYANIELCVMSCLGNITNYVGYMAESHMPNLLDLWSKVNTHNFFFSIRYFPG